MVVLLGALLYFLFPIHIFLSPHLKIRVCVFDFSQELFLFFNCFISQINLPSTRFFFSSLAMGWSNFLVIKLCMEFGFGLLVAFSSWNCLRRGFSVLWFSKWKGDENKMGKFFFGWFCFESSHFQCSSRFITNSLAFLFTLM